MAKGRKATPSKIVNLRGGTKHTHRPPRDQEPQPPEKMPRCPAHLDDVAKKEWERMGKILMNVGLMTEADMTTLALYAQSYADWVDATVKAREKGPVWVNAAGEPKFNPWLRVSKDARDRMMQNAVLLGAGGASSRVNLKVNKPKAKSKADAFMDRKKGGKT